MSENGAASVTFIHQSLGAATPVAHTVACQLWCKNDVLPGAIGMAARLELLLMLQEPFFNLSSSSTVPHSYHPRQPAGLLSCDLQRPRRSSRAPPADPRIGPREMWRP